MPLFTEIEKIDLMGKRKDDGYVELVMILSMPFDGSQQHVLELQSKLKYYIEAIHSQAFEDDYCVPTTETVRIVIQYLHKPHPLLLEIVKNIQPQVEKYGCQLRTEYLDANEALKELLK